MSTETLIIIAIGLGIVSIVLNLLTLTRMKKDDNRKEFKELEKNIADNSEKSRASTLDFLQRQLKQNADAQADLQSRLAAADDRRFSDFRENTAKNIEDLRKTVAEFSNSMDKRFNFFQSQNNEQMKQINRTMEKKMSDLQQNNEKKLDEMRATVDEKLQKTLESRLTESFKQVSERLERVYKSLGEMQKVSAGVDDLKRVLSNVKTRGILGEVQLGSILEQILSPEQYDTNVITKKGSTERVEYAVKMPGSDNGFVYLPIDAKFPLDAYQKLLDAYDSRNRDFVKDAQKELKTRIKGFAKDISTKYIDVPNTTEFAIMFLPTEGLYSEVVRMGLIEELQREKINIAGPTPMAALLNSLQMGFKTLAVQKKSAEVWKVLAEVKTEFAKFSDSLEKTKRIMSKAQDELNTLSGTRMNVMNRKLKDVSTFDYTSDNRVQIAGGEENE